MATVKTKHLKGIHSYVFHMQTTQLTVNWQLSSVFRTGPKCVPEVCLFNFKIRLSFKEILSLAIP